MNAENARIGTENTRVHLYAARAYFRTLFVHGAEACEHSHILAAACYVGPETAEGAGEPFETKVRRRPRDWMPPSPPISRIWDMAIKKKTQRPALIVPEERVARGILVIRGHKVLLDADLAELYGVTTKRVNEQVKRNLGRFPADFLFPLTAEEKAQVVANCDHLQRLKFSPALPNAFTEHGAIMAASVLNTPRAVEMSVFVVRTFVRLRQMLASNAQLARKLAALEKKYDTQFQVVFDAIRELMTPPEPKKKRPIGFAPWEEQ